MKSMIEESSANPDAPPLTVEAMERAIRDAGESYPFSTETVITKWDLTTL